ncbi:alpha/beta hydrolase [Streptosporangium sp. NPDC001559]|uniref:alpha/beta hydrolase family protein n=1 Tax=Streptosporangium sp. NPDC001559 TaxID=3366187 RepID=UPI0036E4372C
MDNEPRRYGTLGRAPGTGGRAVRGGLAVAVGLLALLVPLTPASASGGAPVPATLGDGVPPAAAVPGSGTPEPSAPGAGALPTAAAPGSGTTPAPSGSGAPVPENSKASGDVPVTAARLPAPTGPHPVGTVSLYLKDTSRPDPWVPSVKVRELMVSLWYPAASRHGRRAPYMTPQESEALLKGEGLTDLPPGVLAETRTNAVLGARPAGRGHGLPLVVLSPGFIRSRKTLTGLAEELASRGYVVAGIDHTYESRGTSFPDGRLATCVACEVDHEEGFGEKAVAVRAADVSFVLDELTGPRPKWAGASLIDPGRIAMAGHSLGGASSLAAMLKDGRVRAGIDMDGTTYAPIPQEGIARPFMFLASPEHTPGGASPAWDRDWGLMTGWKRWLTVAGAQHSSFTDLISLADQLGVPHEGELSGDRSMKITRDYVLAFFDRHLRGRSRPLLDGPSAHYPEVGHCSPPRNTCS